MSGKKLSVLNTERRLRPIYEQLDAGTPNKALAEIDRLLKKAPYCSHANLVKALALVRVGKNDEARAIIQQVANSEESIHLVNGESLQILTMCCKELGEPDIVCKILERRVLKEQSEESVVHYFMSLIRVSDFKRMHQIALSMYKTFHNPAYFSWAISSLILPMDLGTGPLPYTTTLSLQLAERMTEKFLTEEKTKNGEVNTLMFGPLLNLYIQVLMRQSSDWSKILDVFHIKGYLPQDISTWQWNVDHENYCEVMVRAGRKSELFQYLRDLFLKHNEFSLLKQIVNIFGNDDATLDQTLELMKDLRVDHGSFEVALGNLYFADEQLKRQTPNKKILEWIEDDLKMAIKYGSDRTNFFPEAIQYFKLVDLETQIELLESMRPSLETDDKFNIINWDMSSSDIVKNINFEIARREVLGKTLDSRGRKKLANICCAKYLTLLKGYKLRFPVAPKNELEVVKTKEQEEEEIFAKETANKYMNQFMLLAASILFAEYDNRQKTAESLDVSSEADSKDKANKEHQQVADQFLIAGICILEYCCTETPNSVDHTVRLLLSNAYARLGASHLMWSIMFPIEIKQIQWDSLGYLVIPMLLTTGSYDEAYIILNQAHLVYSTFENDTVDMVVLAYDHCNFGQARDFLAFRDQLLQSTQCGLILTEKLLLEYMTDTTSLDHLKYQAVKVTQQLDLAELMKISCHDNRDLTVLQNVLEAPIDCKGMKETTAELDKLWFHQRLSLLTVLTKLSQQCFKCSTKPKKAGVGEVKEDIVADELTGLENAIEKYQQFSEMWVALEKELPVESGSHYFGIYPPQQARHFQLSLPCYHTEQLKCVIQLIKEEKSDNGDLNRLKDLQETFGKQAMDLLKILNENLATFKQDPNDSFFLKYAQDCHFILEFFAFSKIIFAVGVTVTKRGLLEGTKGKSKGKRRKIVQQVLAVVKEILVHFQKLTEVLCQFTNFLKKLPLATWPDTKFTSDVFRQSPEIKYLLEVFPSTYDPIRRRIRDSHLNQLVRMSDISELLMQFVSDMD